MEPRRFADVHVDRSTMFYFSKYFSLALITFNLIFITGSVFIAEQDYAASKFAKLLLIIRGISTAIGLIAIYLESSVLSFVVATVATIAVFCGIHMIVIAIFKAFFVGHLVVDIAMIIPIAIFCIQSRKVTT